MENQNLAQGVKELRKRKALSQDELAKNAGLSLRTVQRVENGETIPTGETLKRLAAVLEVTPNELLDFTSEKEVAKMVLRAKHEYVHVFNDKLVFSKTPEINLVEDYGKSVNYIFRVLIVMMTSISVFIVSSFCSYNVGNTTRVFMSATFVFFYLIRALDTMLFSSVTPVINITDITNIKIENKLFYNIVNISIIESGRIKQREVVLEKGQAESVIDVLLAENLLDKKDIKINSKNDNAILILCFLYIIGVVLFIFYNPKQLSVTACFNSGILLFLCLVSIFSMLQKSVFLNQDTLKKRFSR